MLSPVPDYAPPTEEDRRIFEALVPSDHYLHRVGRVIDFDRFRAQMAPCYSPNWGRSAIEPVLLLKLEFLQYHDRLSDRQVVEQAQVNIAYREFLDLSLTSELPHPSLLSHFRGRLGVEGHRRVFDDLIAQAREHGLVKDRLRLKDATHVIANVALPPVIGLVSGVRDKLLETVQPYDPEWVTGQRIRVDMIREDDAGASLEQRLEQRVTHLLELVSWVEEFVKQPGKARGKERLHWHRLSQTLEIAHKVLSDRDHPKAKDVLASLEDTDARFGYHHGSYCGYKLDISMDADSELVTSINVLPGNANEATDAAELIRQEEQVHGNDVQAISADAALFQGEALRELTDPEGLELEVFVPPVKPAPTEYFAPHDFQLDESGQTLTCPAGQQTSCRKRNHRNTAWAYLFAHSICAKCLQREKCMAKLPRGHGRSVNKSDYAVEYAAARAKAQTAEYAAVRRQHMAVERKLGEIVCHHGGRRARSRGQPKVLVQELMATVVVNVRRIVQLLRVQPTPQGAG